MTREAFEQVLLSHLDRSLRDHPGYQSEDIVKFIFQGMLGVGHLLAAREKVIAYIDREMSALQPDPRAPLLEPLSPAWSRLDLRRAMAEGISSASIADRMLQAPDQLPFTRQDVFDLCTRLADCGRCSLTRDGLECILVPDWLPSHSERYRDLYHPAYRVIPTGQ